MKHVFFVSFFLQSLDFAILASGGQRTSLLIISLRQVIVKPSLSYEKICDKHPSIHRSPGKGEHSI